MTKKPGATVYSCDKVQNPKGEHLIPTWAPPTLTQTCICTECVHTTHTVMQSNIGSEGCELLIEHVLSVHKAMASVPDMYVLKRKD